MKLLNYTTSYLAAVLFFIISIWAALFYYAMLDEIYDSIDDGLDNQKLLLIQKASVDSTVLNKSSFDESLYTITEVPFAKAHHFNDVYIDTMMYMQNEKDYEPVRMLSTVFQQNNRYYQMRIITSMVEEDDLIAELLYALIWLYAGLVITIIFLNNILLKRIWSPFYKLLNSVKKFRLDRPKIPDPEKTRVNEFRMLNETVNKLLQSNVDTYTNQKHFIENAAHELQTPLAISINKLEAFLEQNKLPETDVSLITSAIDNLQRLTRLNKSLLLLSKIENNQFGNEEPITINETVREIVSEFNDQLEYNKIKLTLQEEEVCTINMNADLANVLILNLAKNAMVHNYNGGFINIFIKKHSLVIENSGKDKELDKEKIFNRFYKAEASSSSTGLGLAIIKAIAQLSHFDVQYAYQNKHIISVHFKK